MTLILLLRPTPTATQALDGADAGFSATGATVIPGPALLPGSAIIPTEAVLTVVHVPPFLVMPPRQTG